MKDKNETLKKIVDKQRAGLDLTAKDLALKKLYGVQLNEQIRKITRNEKKSRNNIY